MFAGTSFSDVQHRCISATSSRSGTRVSRVSRLLSTISKCCRRVQLAVGVPYLILARARRGQSCVWRPSPGSSLKIRRF
jgi:hypothetical protein